MRRIRIRGQQEDREIGRIRIRGQQEDREDQNQINRKTGRTRIRDMQEDREIGRIGGSESER